MAKKAPLIAITGATGFVGRYVLAAVLVEGYRVRALTRSKNEITHKNLEWFSGSLGSDDAGLVKGAEVVIHIAGLIKAKRKSDYYAINADAAGALAAAAQSAGVGRFIQLSSMAARQPDLSDYAGSKQAGELAVKANFKGPIAIIRAPAIFGPGDAATAPFIKLMQRGYLPAPGGKGWQHRKLSFAYVDDLAKDIAKRSLKGKHDDQTVSPATIGSTTWPEFAAAAAEASERSVVPIPIPLSVLYPIAGVTSMSSRLLGAGHLTLGKLKEFLYDDWSSDDVIPGATPFTEALTQTLRGYTLSKD